MEQTDAVLALAQEWRGRRLPTREHMREVIATLPLPRLIRSLDGSPYLSRYYLHGRPTMPDGSDPFDEFGDVREGTIWPTSGQIVLHLFHRGDRERELHCHPWDFGTSLVLVAGYREERRIAGSGRVFEVEERLYLPGDVNFIAHSDFHRVDLIEHDCWTLFMTGEKARDWGYWNRETGKMTPWREFHDHVRVELKKEGVPT